MTPANPVFYDCEASGIEGFPIEVGWALVVRPTRSIHSEAHLIRPAPSWDVQGAWDPKAEALHGITWTTCWPAAGHPTMSPAG